MEEQIINGVDVSGCDYILQDTRCEIQLALKRVNFECSQISDCLYKQLRRKEEECKELKEQVKYLKEGYISINEEYKYLREQTKKDYNARYDSKKSIDNLHFKLSKKEQALDEIEEVCKWCGDDADKEYSGYYHILQIIQKVKGD